MRKMKKWMLAVAVAASFALLLSGSASGLLATKAVAAETVQGVDGIDLSNAVELALSNDTVSVTKGGEALADDQLKDAGIVFESGSLEIKQGGTYVLSGTFDGTISVSSKGDQVILVLNGITVNAAADNALSVKKTEELTIYLAEGTENVFTSGNINEITETSAIDAEDASGSALNCKAETIITGAGSLIVNGYINNGIQVSKNLTIEAGTIDVVAVNNGIKVKETFKQNGGDINILAGGDALEAKQEAQEATEEVVDETTGEVLQEAQNAKDAAGTIIINGGSLKIDGYGDAITAYIDLVINDGTIDIKTEGEYPEKGESFGGPGGGMGQEGESAEDQGQQGDSQGQEGQPQEGESQGQPQEGQQGESNGEERQDSQGQEGGQEMAPGESEGEAAEDDSVSEKGLKSDGAITINGGTVVIDTVDDAIHAALALTINDGDITISTGDDGLHSDEVMTINGGTVNIQTAYEGVEANQITVAGGDITVIAKDDGFNANGGTESFGGPGDSRQEAAEAAEGAEDAEPVQAVEEEKEEQPMPNFNITGGTIYVNSVGDGLDSNGSITVTGGFTVVDGPENSGNGPLDSGSENGGEIIITGGTIFAGGSSGMAETFEANSTQYSIKVTLSETYQTGTLIKVSKISGEVIFEHEVASTGNCIVFSCPEFAQDEDFILSVGENDYTITLTSVSTQVSISADGTITEGSGGGSGGGPGGGERPEGESEGESQGGERPEGESEGQQGQAPQGESEGQQGQAPQGESEGQQGQDPEGEFQNGQAQDGENAETPVPEA